ncbi:MAG TPA: hypothetical protein DCY17_01255 [Clostridiales bacterium]|nr:hypothetical protein [Clostridiales bacterium]
MFCGLPMSVQKLRTYVSAQKYDWLFLSRKTIVRSIAFTTADNKHYAALCGLSLLFRISQKV